MDPRPAENPSASMICFCSTASAMLIAVVTMPSTACFFCSPDLLPNMASTLWITLGSKPMPRRNNFRKFIFTFSSAGLMFSAQPRDCDVSERKQRAECARQPLQPLHALLMRLHALLQLVQPSWLPNAEQLLHLCLQHTQLGQHLPLELRHTFLIPAGSSRERHIDKHRTREARVERRRARSVHEHVRALDQRCSWN